MGAEAEIRCLHPDDVSETAMAPEADLGLLSHELTGSGQRIQFSSASQSPRARESRRSLRRPRPGLHAPEPPDGSISAWVVSSLDRLDWASSVRRLVHRRGGPSRRHELLPPRVKRGFVERRKRSATTLVGELPASIWAGRAAAPSPRPVGLPFMPQPPRLDPSLLDNPDPVPATALRTRAPGLEGSLPPGDDLLPRRPSGGVFGWARDAGMGRDPRKLGRKELMSLSVQGGPRAPDGSPIALGLLTGLWEAGLPGVATCAKGLPAMMLALAALRCEPSVLIPRGLALPRSALTPSDQPVWLEIAHGSARALLALEGAADLVGGLRGRPDAGAHIRRGIPGRTRLRCRRDPPAARRAGQKRSGSDG